MTLSKALMTSNRDNWETPQELFEDLNNEFNFTLDAASDDMNAKCARHYTIEDDGLAQDWGGETVFCNPPSGRGVKDWAKKAYEESKKPGTTVVLLVASRTDTAMFHDYMLNKAELRFIRGRLAFEYHGMTQNRAPFPSLIAIYRSE